LNGTHQFLIYADDDDLLGENKNSIKKNTEALDDTTVAGLQKMREHEYVSSPKCRIKS